jgi:hypothetical protein
MLVNDAEIVRNQLSNPAAPYQRSALSQDVFAMRLKRLACGGKYGHADFKLIVVRRSESNTRIFAQLAMFELDW